ncbi:MAG: hypothetical protein V2I33_23315 [Kangiellaceae bacterium]|jgi:hypothetical protein|nr:hypothetical protein [Kangiellaceae bacterium]
MAVPTDITDLSTTAGSNSPAGSSSIGTSLDDYLRAIQAIIKANVTKGSDIASNSPTVPANGNYFVVTGTTGITAITSTNQWTGREFVLKFSGIVTLTHSANLILPTGANITTAAGDVLSFVYEDTDIFRCTNYLPATGYEPTLTQATQNEMEAGTVDTVKSMTPEGVKQAIAALESDDVSGVIVTVVTADDATWTPNANTKSIKFTAVGGGGGSGGVDGQGAGTCAVAGAGAGGATAIKTTSTIDTSYAIVVGAGGSGGAAGANNGSAGDDTTVIGSAGPGTNMNLSAGGGGYGLGATAGTGSGATSGTAGGTATGGDINISGGNSGTAYRNQNGVIGTLATAGSSYFGGSLGGTVNANAGTQAVYGAGGQSTAVITLATNYAGGDGANGVVIVEEYV